MDQATKTSPRSVGRRWIVRVAAVLCLGTFVVVACSWRSFATAALVFELHDQPRRALEYMDAPVDSLEMMALERFAESSDGQRGLLQVWIDELVGTGSIRETLEEARPLGGWVSPYTHGVACRFVDEKGDVFGGSEPRTDAQQKTLERLRRWIRPAVRQRVELRTGVMWRAVTEREAFDGFVALEPGEIPPWDNDVWAMLEISGGTR